MAKSGMEFKPNELELFSNLFELKLIKDQSLVCFVMSSNSSLNLMGFIIHLA